jgi:hypothetical protein
MAIYLFIYLRVYLRIYLHVYLLTYLFIYVVEPMHFTISNEQQVQFIHTDIFTIYTHRSSAQICCRTLSQFNSFDSRVICE